MVDDGGCRDRSGRRPPPPPPRWWLRIWESRWMVLVSSSWVETCTGLNVMYATFSPELKTKLGYDQQQIGRLGVAKDFGNAADIIAGCVSQFTSTRALLFLGAAQFLLGYGLLWFALTGRMSTPPFWIIFLLVFIGANAQKYLDMAAVVSTLPSFPDSRGSLLGVLKASKGLSGAIFSHVYSAFFAPKRAAALLIVSVGPASVAALLSPFTRPVQDGQQASIIDSRETGENATYGNYKTAENAMYGNYNTTENAMYVALFSIGFLIAGYMVFLLFFARGVPAGSLESILLFVGLLALILSPVVPALVAAVGAGSRRPEVQNPAHAPVDVVVVDASLVEDVRQQRPPAATDVIDASIYVAGRRSEDSAAISAAPPPPPPLGGELTVSQALRRAELWIFFFLLYCGLGTGSTVLDNLAQMAQAQGYEDTHTFVSIFSISSYVGHLMGGQASELLVRKEIPRPTSLIVLEAIMMAAQFLFAMAWPGSLYVATSCVGLSYGSFSSVNPAISSELFGVRSFGPVFGFLTLAAPASSTVLSGVVAGRMYDREAAKQGSKECKGAACFRTTCFIMAGYCAVGMGMSGVLAWRTRNVYSRLRKKPKEDGGRGHDNY